MRRKTRNALCALLLWAATGLPAMACSPFMPDFPALLEEPQEAIVIGSILSEPGEVSPTSHSNLFLVSEVLQGDLKPGQSYRLMMTGPWGTTCGVSTNRSAGSPAAKDNPVLMLVKRKIDDATLDLPFMAPAALIAGDDVTTARSYNRVPGKGRYDIKYLQTPQRLTVPLDTVRQWLQGDRALPVPWQVVR